MCRSTGWQINNNNIVSQFSDIRIQLEKKINSSKSTKSIEETYFLWNFRGKISPQILALTYMEVHFLIYLKINQMILKQKSNMTLQKTSHIMMHFLQHLIKRTPLSKLMIKQKSKKSRNGFLQEFHLYMEEPILIFWLISQFWVKF